MMLIEPFIQALPIIQTIEKNGHQAFFVGGCVRDYLLKRAIGDIDIATSATPDQVNAMFDQVIPVGIKHGTVIVRHEKQSYEVTTFRAEGSYSDKRHPDTVVYLDNIEKDLERRDFTINAMAMDTHGEIIDLFHGQVDLAKGIIRTVGNGYDRFMEDSLRIIRALRFTSQLGFTIEKNTLEAMIAVQHQIDFLAIERITNELIKLFSGEYVDLGIAFLKKTNIDQHLPIIKDNPRFFERLPVPFPPVKNAEELFCLFTYMNKDISIQDWVKAWKCSNKTKNNAMALLDALQHLKKNELDRWLVYKLNRPLFPSFIRLANTLLDQDIALEHMHALYEQLPIYSVSDLEINGNNLIQLFPDVNQGPWLREMINKIEYAVVVGQVVNNKSEIKEWIKWNPPGIS
ncbi:CCA tRNA nucleotidyltransferase [Virgibacillus sp. MG-45]|uniref:CCA tRNA nucleotidyltransferase n=1 Tax=Virgibacillus sp. MG-45 TaxID=3102791 RepID=UPI002ED86C59